MDREREARRNEKACYSAAGKSGLHIETGGSMSTLWLSLVTFVVLVAFLLIVSGIAAEGAIQAAKHGRKYTTPIVTIATSTVAIGLCAGMVLIFVQHFGNMVFGWHIEQKFKILIFCFAGLGLWLLITDMAQRIIRRYYPGTTFEPGNDLAIAKLGVQRPGEGAIQDLFCG